MGNYQELLINFLRKTDCVKKGHFRLSQLLDSDTYIDKDLISSQSWLTYNLAAKLTKILFHKIIDIDGVVGVAPSGSILAQNVAVTQYLLLPDRPKLYPFTYAEKDIEIELLEGYRPSYKEKLIFRKSFRPLIKNKNILLIEDIYTTGATVEKMIQAVQENHGRVVGLGLIWNRSSDESLTHYNFPVCALINKKLPAWPKEECPLCQKGVLLDKKY